MTLAAGTRLGSYEVTAAIGAGEMGEVYRATDTKLGRAVALKVLPEAFASDPERLARFEREAKLLASLNHSNIAHVYGFESAALPDGSTGHFLAMELVEGEDLAERIKRGAIPVDEAIAIAKQIAEALEEAHEKGIVHRDLKPANVKVTPDGKVKVLDFGLAKAYAGNTSSGSSADLSHSPTLAHTGTEAGLILGTAAYMSPEQARGKPVDRRADIWAFGVVLFEMLSGRRLFMGETVSDVLASVLRAEIDLDALPEAAPPAIRSLVRRCLVRDPKSRQHDIADARIVLEEALSGEGEGKGARRPEAVSQAGRWWIAAALAVAGLALAYAGVVSRRPGRASSPVVRLRVDARTLDFSTGTLPFAITPDGAALVYVDYEGPATQLFLRRMDSFVVHPVAGTEGAGAPFFSPRGDWIGFYANGQIRKVSVAGGRPITLCAAPHAPGGATWLENDTIVFSMAFTPTGLYRVRSGGGPSESLTVPDGSTGPSGHSDPQALPGGRSILFTVSADSGQQVALLSLDTGRWTSLGDVRGRARYVPGYLVYGDAESLLAVPFDAARGEITGPPVTALEGVRAFQGGASFAVSRAGVLAYLPGTPKGLEHVWVDRSGKATSLGIEDESGGRPILSRDGKRLAVSGGTGVRGRSFHVYDLARGGRIRLPGGFHVQWSPDDSEIVTSFRGAGVSRIDRERSDGSGAPEPVFDCKHNCSVTGLSPDGQWVLYYEQHPETSRDIWARRLDGSGEARRLVATSGSDRAATFSPNGRWFAYASNVSGRDEIYVRSFDPAASTSEHLVSTNGGREPQWSRDGKELFYRVGPSMMAVDVDAAGTFRAGEPRKLFEGSWAVETGGMNQMYDVAPDGRRFVMVRADEQWSRINLVLGWLSELERLAAEGRR